MNPHSTSRLFAIWWALRTESQLWDWLGVRGLEKRSASTRELRDPKLSPGNVQSFLFNTAENVLSRSRRRHGHVWESKRSIFFCLRGIGISLGINKGGTSHKPTGCWKTIFLRGSLCRLRVCLLTPFSLSMGVEMFMALIRSFDGFFPFRFSGPQQAQKLGAAFVGLDLPEMAQGCSSWLRFEESDRTKGAAA